MRRKDEGNPLADRLAMLESALDAVSEGVIITDEQGRIIYYNQALAKIEGLDGTRVVGRYLTDVYQVMPEKSEHLAATKSGRQFQEVAKHYFTADGRQVSLVASTYPVRREGRILGAFSVCRDVTRLKELLGESLRLQKELWAGDRGRAAPGNGTRYTFADLVHASPVMQNLLRQAEKAARTDCPVLVYGETGTGKEVLVQSLHNASARREQPFVGINCAAIPDALLESLLFGTVKGAFTGAVDSPGLLEQAGGGTLFLDEINSMSPALQAKLLRVVQERTFRRVGGRQEITVQCRIISSTNMDPWQCIRKGTLREDLYYRLAVLTLPIPPLRERPEDIEALVNHFINQYGKIYGQGRVRPAPELQEAFLRYHWPGNVRELKHVIESCLVMLEAGEEVITFQHLPACLRPRLTRSKVSGYVSAALRSGGSLQQMLEEVERQLIKEVLQKNQGNITRAAGALGVLRQNLQYRMRRLGIKAGAGGGD